MGKEDVTGQKRNWVGHLTSKGQNIKSQDVNSKPKISKLTTRF